MEHLKKTLHSVTVISALFFIGTFIGYIIFSLLHKNLGITSMVIAHSEPSKFGSMSLIVGGASLLLAIMLFAAPREMLISKMSEEEINDRISKIESDLKEFELKH